MTPLPKAKLQLLYLIHKADTPARYEELVEACVDWLPYFDFQLSLNELVEHHVDIVEVAGSSPVSPTNSILWCA